MALTEEYRELIDNADSAIRALLAESCEEAFIDLRAGLRELGQEIRNDEAQERLRRLDEESRERDEELRRLQEALDERQGPRRSEAVKDERDYREERWERAKAWRRAPAAWKEGLIIEAIGEDQMRPDDVVKHMNERLGWAANPCVPHSSVESLLRRLVDSNQLDRAQLPVGGRDAWHYFRRRDLRGSIADLERAYHDDNEAVA